MVEHSNIDPEIEGLNLAAAKCHKKMGVKAIAGACILKLISTVIYGFHNKLECLSLESLSSLVWCLVTNTLAYYRNRKLRL